LRSQWMTRWCRRSDSEWRIWTANRRMRTVEKPAKLLALTSSYRLMLNSSVTMHKWPRNVNDSTILMTKCFSSGSCRGEGEAGQLAADEREREARAGKGDGPI